MQSFKKWRIKKLYEEIAVATNPEHIIQGLPTLDSVKESIWGDSKVPPNIPSTEKEPIANGNKDIPEEREESDEIEPNSTAPSVNSGGLASNRPTLNPSTFRKLREKPTPVNPGMSNARLGDRGMGYIGASTFDSPATQAGETPTLSHGMPVGGPTGQFGAV